MLLDSSVLIEYFIKSEKSYKIVEILDSEECQLSIVSLAEVCDILLRHGHNPIEMLDDIKEVCEIVELNTDIAMLAGKLHFERKMRGRSWGMMDTFVLATAILNNWKILTTDNDFAGLDNAEVI